jgi:flagellar hook protein FlgE
MSVFGSLFTAVSALSSQSQSLGMISNNIANVNTVGYKRTDAAFSSLVTTQSRSTIYSPGSVRASQNARIDQQGLLQQSASSTDVAISGNGFFVVQRGTGFGTESLFTRAGSFSEDATGVLKNTAGFSLMGWPLDQDGNLPSGQADIGSLVPVDVAFLGGLTQPTSTAELALNLDAGEAEAAYPVAAGSNPDFTRTIRVYDSIGEGQDLIVNFNKHETPTATVQGTEDLTDTIGDLSTEPNIDPTDTFDITVGGTTATITLDGDLGKLLSDLNGITDINGNQVLFAEVDGIGQLVLKSRNLDADITLVDGVGTPLADGGLGLTAGATAAVNSATIDFLTGNPPPNTPNTEGWWQVQILTPNGTIIDEGSINFTGDGQLNETPDLDGNVDVALQNIDFGNGSLLQDIDFDISNFTQFAGEYNVIFTEQNGAELGLRTGVSIDDEGFVSAQFSNGQSTRIYKLPIATFANANGLDQLSGNVYRESDTSGNYNLREANQGSAGVIESGTLEGSNVDLADEFSKMIVTQRAYSAGTKVITTADEMTAELLRLR